MIVLILLCLYLRKIIFRETLLILLVIILCLQGSSLWRTLIVVPARLVLIYSFRSINITSGLLIIIYVIVFIGGLLIFLISVASISPQEQRSNISSLFTIMVLVIALPLILLTKKLTSTSRWIIFSVWFWGEETFIIIIISVLLLTLLVVTRFFLNYKGFIRRI